MKIRQTRRFKLVAFALAVAALGVAFGLGWHLGTNDTDKKAYAAVWEAISTLSEPEQCALCGNGEGMRYHAPCLVDLSTGEVGELRTCIHRPKCQMGKGFFRQTKAIRRWRTGCMSRRIDKVWRKKTCADGVERL